jgi:hypothetical protein
MLDGTDAQGETVLERTGKEVGGHWRLPPPPVAQRLRDISRIIDHPIHLPFAVVDADGLCPDIDGGPGERADLPDAQPTAQHEQKHRPIPEPIDDPEQTEQVVFGHQFGQGVGHLHLMAAPIDRLLGDPAVVLQEGKKPVQAFEDGVDSRWRAPAW